MFSKVTFIVMIWTVMLLVSGFVSVVPVWILWNALMPDLFGVPELTFWRAFGLVILSGLLFGDRLSLKMHTD